MEIERAREIMRMEKSEIPKDVEEVLKTCKAFWTYQGLPGEPHVILTSALHSDAYFNMNSVLQFPNLCEVLAEDLIRRLKNYKITEENVDAVLSSSFAAITLGQEVARQLKAMFVFTEKKGKEQIWTGRFELPKGTRILQVEELITTLGTTQKVREAVLKENPGVDFIKRGEKILVATIVYRPDVHRPDWLPISYPNYYVFSLMTMEIHKWSPGECPLCKAGSRVLAGKAQWQELLKWR